MIRRAKLATLSLSIAFAMPLAAQAMMSDPATPDPAAASTTAPQTSGLYAQAQAAIGAGNYQAAMAPLQQIVAADPRNADAFNLLGYASRNLGDINGARGYYQRALAIDPEHLGANEYYGELMLMFGDLSGAQERLALLDEICYLGCDEYDALEAAIERFMTAE